MVSQGELEAVEADVLVEAGHPHHKPWPGEDGGGGGGDKDYPMFTYLSSLSARALPKLALISCKVH